MIFLVKIKSGKKKGVALVSVMLVLVVTSILCLSLFSIYRSTFKQTLYSFEVSSVDYASLSALNVIISYITNNNAEFLSKYNAHLINNDYDRETPFCIELSQDDLLAKVYITSDQSEDITTLENTDEPITYTYIITNYYLESVVSSEKNDYISKTFVDIEQVSSDMFDTYFNIGNYKY